MGSPRQRASREEMRPERSEAGAYSEEVVDAGQSDSLQV
jgi:hypothetical protein